MSSQVKVLNVTHVQAETLNLPPYDPIKLSFFDAIWIPLPPIQRLFFYEGADLSPFSLFQSLRSSLATVLTRFPPLAGKLAYVPSSGDVIVDCSVSAVGPGVAFVEAESDGDIHRLSSDDEHDIEAFARLVPELDTTVLPVPTLAVQVTRFVNGAGVAVGVSIHHSVADGRSVWQFMQAWTAACRTGSLVAPELVAPTFDRAAIRHPRREEIARKFLHQFAPALPVAISSHFSAEERMRMRRRTFVLGAEQIQSLKQRIGQLSKSTDEQAQPPTTFVAVTALVWTAIVRAKSLNREDDARLLITADCRSRLDPPLDEGFFGNCIAACYPRAMVSDLHGEDALVHASSAIQKAVREFSEEPLADVEGWIENYLSLPFARLTNLVSSPRFKVYETDFGFGRPSRVELVSMNRDGEVALAGAREDGGVQVSVSLNPMNMEAFKTYFHDLSG